MRKGTGGPSRKKLCRAFQTKKSVRIPAWPTAQRTTDLTRIDGRIRSAPRWRRWSPPWLPPAAASHAPRLPSNNLRRMHDGEKKGHGLQVKAKQEQLSKPRDLLLASVYTYIMKNGFYLMERLERRSTRKAGFCWVVCKKAIWSNQKPVMKQRTLGGSHRQTAPLWAHAVIAQLTPTMVAPLHPLQQSHIFCIYIRLSAAWGKKRKAKNVRATEQPNSSNPCKWAPQVS